jgi:hypothetical protein
MTEYRVIKTTTVGFGDEAKQTDEVVWQGSDTDELSRQYPPSEIFGADRLGHSEIEGGHIRFDCRFERLEGEAWVEIKDPRRRITPMTAVEREIDAENRRLYPGDFWDGCDSCGDPTCWGECQDPSPFEEDLLDLALEDAVVDAETALDRDSDGFLRWPPGFIWSHAEHG